MPLSFKNTFFFEVGFRLEQIGWQTKKITNVQISNKCVGYSNEAQNKIKFFVYILFAFFSFFYCSFFSFI